MKAAPSHLSEFVPMQQNKYGRIPEHHEEVMVHHTTVHVPNLPPPRDHVIWSLCSFVYGNPFCLGLVALYFSVMSRDRKVVGDMEGAKSYGSTACCLNTASLALLMLMVIAMIIFFVSFVSSFSY